MKQEILKNINEHISLAQSLKDDSKLIAATESAIQVILSAYGSGKKVLFCGNGGSAADAEHLAGELSGRFKLNRDPLFAEALHVNSAALTAISNDYSFEDAYARILQSKAQEGDVLFAMSTSGMSKNILKAMALAKHERLHVIGISGNVNSPFSDRCDIHIKINSTDTPRIQELSILLGHIICESVEKNIFT